MVEETYNQTKKIVAKRIKDGSLPKGYVLPPLDSFKPIEVQPSFKPVFVPKGLTLDQWDTLLGKTCNGLWHSSEWQDSPGEGWELTQIFAGDRPSKTDIAYDEGYDHCSAQEYLALQWYLLETKQEPVDKSTWSFLSREGFSGSGLVPVGSWFPGVGRVDLDWFDAGGRVGGRGVRPSGRGLALAPSTSGGSLPFDFPEIQVNGVTYVRKA